MKRRRLNDNASMLSKPFKSPLVAKPQPKEADPGPQQDVPDKSMTEPPTNQISSQDSLTTPTRIVESRKPFHYSSDVFQTAPNNASSIGSTDPTVVALRKRHSALLMQLSKYKQQLDTVEQALQVLKHNKDEELQTLVAKWKNTSREVAEEVFKEAKEKINRMGGVGAWRERSTSRPSGWEEQEQFEQQDLTDEQKEEIDFMKQEMAEETRKYGLQEKEEQINDDDVISIPRS